MGPQECPLPPLLLPRRSAPAGAGHGVGGWLGGWGGGCRRGGQRASGRAGAAFSAARPAPANPCPLLAGTRLCHAVRPCRPRLRRRPVFIGLCDDRVNALNVLPCPFLHPFFPILRCLYPHCGRPPILALSGVGMLNGSFGHYFAYVNAPGYGHHYLPRRRARRLPRIRLALRRRARRLPRIRRARRRRPSLVWPAPDC